MSMDTLLFECIGMKAGGKFPIENTGRGQDVSPEFLIKNLSPAAKTLPVTLSDVMGKVLNDQPHRLRLGLDGLCDFTNQVISIK